MLKIILAIVVAGSLFHTLVSHAAGFDCSKAATPNEKLICSDKLLSEMDEHYSNLYKLVRKEAANSSELSRRVKQSAILAYRTRDNQCSNRSCLTRWYNKGRARLSQQLWQIRPSYLSKTLSGQLLYERLNLRTFGNLMGPRLKSVDSNYLSELYPEASATVQANSVLIEHNSEVWAIKIVDNSTIEISTTILRTSYRTHETLKVYFDPIAKEVRSGMPSHCNLLADGTSPNFSQAASLEHLSHGEIQLRHEIPPSTVDLFESPNGALSGQFHIAIENIAQPNDPEPFFKPTAILCDIFFNPLTNLSYAIRMKYDSNLLFFDRRGDWINLSDDESKPAWLPIQSLPGPMSGNIASREKIMLSGSGIRVKSAHRLRSQPTTQSSILHVLQESDTSEQALITPLEIVGDWMKVKFIAPNPNFEAGSLDRNTSEDTTYTKLEGWIKWRKQPANEYVYVDYEIGM